MEKGLGNRLCIIPGGYLHLDENIQQHNDYSGPVDSIIYAPTLALADYPHCELASSIQDGPLILQTLLENFPQYNIIFRPHPSDLRLAEINRQDERGLAFKQSLELCLSHPRCILDDNPGDYMDSYNRSAMMVSDTSSTAMTFAFTTGKPVIFYTPYDDRLIQAMGNKSRFLQDRCKIGAIVSNKDELNDKISEYMENSPQHRKNPLDFRDSVIFNVGSAASYFAENIDYILEEKQHANWIYINW